MQTTFLAVWYDPKKCEARAVKAGWNPKSGDGFLDVYMPDEDPNGADSKQFKTLNEAVAFARKLVTDGGDFWGQACVDEYEIVPRNQRCKYCICRGERHVRHHIVDDSGLVETINENNCLDED